MKNFCGIAFDRLSPRIMDITRNIYFVQIFVLRHFLRSDNKLYKPQEKTPQIARKRPMQGNTKKWPAHPCVGHPESYHSKTEKTYRKGNQFSLSPKI